MLRLHDIEQAERAARHAEAVHCAMAPIMCGAEGQPLYAGFLDRMNAVRQPAADPDAALFAAEIAIFERIEARAVG